MNPFLILICGMAIVIGGILWLRWHPFLALVLAALVVATLTPSSALRDFAQKRVSKGELTASAAEKLIRQSPAARVAEEFGRTCANLGILIAMATIIGESMLRSGAAEVIATQMLRKLGAARAHWAFFASSFFLCGTVMLDTVMYLLAPLFKAVARKTGRDYLLLVMCTVAGGTITHSLVPPSPGPLFVAEALGVPLGLMIGMGGAIGLGAALTGVVFAKWSNRRMTLEIPAEETSSHTALGLTGTRPALWVALLPVVLPLVLIGLDASVTPRLQESGSAWAGILTTLGNKNLALTLGALAALMPLALNAARGACAKVVQSALMSGGVILLIIAAGGAFGGVLQQTLITQSLASRFEGFHTLALPVIFIITTLVRTAQGSATVAMITAAPIAKALLAGGAAVHPVYFAIAIGCGSKPFPWMNDAGFWIITRLSGLRETQTLRTVSPMMSLQGVAGLLLTMLCARLFPLQ
jgi:GntP family gluconate:H+ symporter